MGVLFFLVLFIEKWWVSVQSKHNLCFSSGHKITVSPQNSGFSQEIIIQMNVISFSPKMGSLPEPRELELIMYHKGKPSSETLWGLLKPGCMSSWTEVHLQPGREGRGELGSHVSALFWGDKPEPQPGQLQGCRLGWDSGVSPRCTFSSVQSLSCVRLFATPWTVACQASLSITNSWSLLKLMPIESVMLSSHLILSRPLLLPSSIFPSISVFCSESALCIRWPK